jgi:hypothetical protein
LSSRAADGPRKLKGAFPVLKASFELGLFYGQQDCPESGSWGQAHSLKIIACDQLRGIHFFGRSFHKKPLYEGIGIEISVA